MRTQLLFPTPSAFPLGRLRPCPRRTWAVAWIAWESTVLSLLLGRCSYGVLHGGRSEVGREVEGRRYGSWWEPVGTGRYSVLPPFPSTTSTTSTAILYTPSQPAIIIIMYPGVLVTCRVIVYLSINSPRRCCVVTFWAFLTFSYAFSQYMTLLAIPIFATVPLSFMYYHMRPETASS